jgi:hypothetical protein
LVLQPAPRGLACGAAAWVCEAGGTACVLASGAGVGTGGAGCAAGAGAGAAGAGVVDGVVLVTVDSCAIAADMPSGTALSAAQTIPMAAARWKKRGLFPVIFDGSLVAGLKFGITLGPKSRKI